MARADEKSSYVLRQELAELQVALLRKRSEVSNLTVGFTRATEGEGAIPAEPLRRNLVAARAELTELETRERELQRHLREAETAEAEEPAAATEAC
jgi:O-acetyl-ADP-ribose deacetylase (regulator of RNase III)